MLDLEHQISDELKIEIEKLHTRIRKIENEYGNGRVDPRVAHRGL